jgi:hypothetical protein
MAHHTSTVDSGTTSIFLDFETATGIALTGSDSDGDGAFDLAYDEFVALVGDGFETTDLVFV